MSVLAPVYLALPGLAVRRLAPRHLMRYSSPDTTKRIVRAALIRHKLYKGTRPRYSFGVNILLRHLAWDRALFEAASAEGLSETDAGAVVTDTKWDVFGPLNTLAYRVSRIRSRANTTRVGWLLDALFRFLFTSPFERTKHSTDGLAFDVTSCPIARYCQDHNVAHLARYAACDLDYRMAQIWGVQLRRTQTLAAGGACCDFRFHTHDKEGPE